MTREILTPNSNPPDHKDSPQSNEEDKNLLTSDKIKEMLQKHGIDDPEAVEFVIDAIQDAINNNLNG